MRDLEHVLDFPIAGGRGAQPGSKQVALGPGPPSQIRAIWLLPGAGSAAVKPWQRPVNGNAI